MTRSLAWMSLAACKDADLSIFFPGIGGGHKEAKAVCVTCPVQEECREFAKQGISDGVIINGVWGGENVAELRGAKPREDVELSDRPCNREGCEQLLPKHPVNRKYCSARCRKLAWR